MAKKFPVDEFDNLPAHGGRHRLRRTGVDRVREFFKYMAVSVIVASAGYLALTWSDSQNIFNDPAPKPTAVADSTLSYPVTVLDATDSTGAASKVGHKILDAGWLVVTADNAADKADKTVIYYSNVDYKATAAKLQGVVGKYPTELSNSYSDPITIVLGADFQK